MLRRLLLLFLALLLFVVVAALTLPFLISTQPLPAAGDARGAAGPDSRFLDLPSGGTGDVRIHYLQGHSMGDAPAADFLLLHGFTFNAYTWDGVLGFFANRGRTYAYDQVPYGLSAKLTGENWQGENPYTKDAALERLFAFMDTVGMRRATLVGNSSGGTLALEAAFARPERVERLVLVAPWVYAQRPILPAWVAELPQMRRLSLLIGRKLGEGPLLDLSYEDAARIDAERRDLMLVHTRVENWDLAWGELLKRSLSSPVDIHQRLGLVRQPVLLVTGDRDALVPPVDTRRAAESLPDASLEVLPGCGHVPQEECPEAFTQAVSRWLDAHPVGASLSSP
jgi:pimeloyl-ACP methyl ester carboxylesterase